MTSERPAIDNSAWPRGPWDDEPDYLQWKDEATGLPCLIVRNNTGALCGYVGVDRSHALYGVSYHEAPERCHNAVHGCLTYSDKCSGNICHTPEPGETDDVWWFGFDCAHYCDFVPGYPRYSEWGGTYRKYRKLGYVKANCRMLAKALDARRETEAPCDD